VLRTPAVEVTFETLLFSPRVPAAKTESGYDGQNDVTPYVRVATGVNDPSAYASAIDFTSDTYSCEWLYRKTAADTPASVARSSFPEHS